MRNQKFDIDVADAATDGLATGLTGAGPWDTSDFTLVAPSDGLAHQLSISSTANIATLVFTITGEDADGKAITDTITGINNSTVETTKYFSSWSALSVSATLGANTVDVGWVDEVVTKTIPIDWISNTGATLAVDVTGTINYTTQQTFDDIQASATASQTAQWLSVSAGQTADLVASAAVGATAVRLVVNSYSSGAEAQLWVAQPVLA